MSSYTHANLSFLKIGTIKAIHMLPMLRKHVNGFYMKTAAGDASSASHIPSYIVPFTTI